MKLEKSIYGLKEAPHLWNVTIDKMPKLFEFNSLISNNFYVYISGSCISFVMLTLYVDDLLATEGSKDKTDEVRNTLMAEFCMRDLGDIPETWGIQVEKEFEAGTISLSQE